jgi:hypothetical protein
MHCCDKKVIASAENGGYAKIVEHILASFALQGNWNGIFALCKFGILPGFYWPPDSV